MLCTWLSVVTSKTSILVLGHVKWLSWFYVNGWCLYFRKKKKNKEVRCVSDVSSPFWYSDRLILNFIHHFNFFFYWTLLLLVLLYIGWFEFWFLIIILLFIRCSSFGEAQKLQSHSCIWIHLWEHLLSLSWLWTFSLVEAKSWPTDILWCQW